MHDEYEHELGQVHDETGPLPIRTRLPSEGRSPSARPRRSVTPLPVDLADAEARLERLTEAEARLNNLSHAAQLAEDEREDEFRAHEEDRDRLFREGEERRADEARAREETIIDELRAHKETITDEFRTRKDIITEEFQAHEEDRDRLFREGEERRAEEARARTEIIMQELDNRLAAAARPFEPPTSPIEPPARPIEPPAPPIEPPAPPIEPPAPPTEPPTRPLEPPAEPELVVLPEADAASIHSRATAQLVSEVLETIKAEREQFEREREEHAAERERLIAEAAFERTRLEEEREIRIRALEDELATVRAELENEKQQRQTMEAEQREQESQALLERDEAMRNQLGDLTNLVQEQRDATEQKRTLMDMRYDEKKHRQEEKDRKWSYLEEMVRKLAEDMTETKEMAIAAKIESGQNPSRHSKLVIIVIALELLYLWQQQLKRSLMSLESKMRSKGSCCRPCLTVCDQNPVWTSAQFVYSLQLGAPIVLNIIEKQLTASVPLLMNKFLSMSKGYEICQFLIT